MTGNRLAGDQGEASRVAAEALAHWTQELGGWRMTASAYERGHLILYIDGVWVYADTGAPVDGSRPCVRCGRLPLPGGEDACLGHIPGAASACCGHGVEDPYAIAHPVIAGAWLTPVTIAHAARDATLDR
jgi:hypothetical protein